MVIIVFCLLNFNVAAFHVTITTTTAFSVTIDTTNTFTVTITPTDSLLLVFLYEVVDCAI